MLKIRDQFLSNSPLQYLGLRYAVRCFIKKFNFFSCHFSLASSQTASPKLTNSVSDTSFRALLLGTYRRWQLGSLICFKFLGICYFYSSFFYVFCVFQCKQKFFIENISDAIPEKYKYTTLESGGDLYRDHWL